MFESGYFPTLITTEHMISLLGVSQSDSVTEQAGPLRSAKQKDQTHKQWSITEKIIYCRAAKQGDRRQISNLLPQSAFEWG